MNDENCPQCGRFMEITVNSTPVGVFYGAWCKKCELGLDE